MNPGAWRVRGLIALAVAFGVRALVAFARAEPGGEPLSPAETAAIVALGPWPPPAPADPSNRFLGSPDAIALGGRLFFDERLSRLGVIACASCHRPDRAFTDGRIRASAAARLDRNTPTVLDVGSARVFGWDGASDSLWAQSIRPILEPRELGADAEHVASLIAEDTEYAALYRRMTGRGADGTPSVDVLVDIAKALAAYQATLVSPRTAFDRLRDAAADRTPRLGDDPHAALRGLRLFIGRGQCIACHSGPRLTDEQFHAVLPIEPVQGSRIDRGRPDGLVRRAASPFGRDGRHSDSRTPIVSSETTVEGAFKTPSLRSVTLTAPYMHDGRHATLSEAVRHGPGAAALTAADVADLVAFLATLAPE